MRRHVGKVQDLPSGSRKIVAFGGRSGIGVFNVNGKFHAVKNVCPHQGGPLCQGRLRPHVRSSGPYHVTWEREGEILKCPWHNWEFDLKTGRALYDSRLRVRKYRVTIEGDEVYLNLD